MKSLIWKLLATVATLGGAAVANQVLTTTWRGFTGMRPPTVPEDPETTVTEALAWAALSGAVVGVARMYATRQAAQYFMRSTGELPKPLQRG